MLVWEIFQAGWAEILIFEGKRSKPEVWTFWGLQVWVKRTRERNREKSEEKRVRVWGWVSSLEERLPEKKNRAESFRESREIFWEERIFWGHFFSFAGKEAFQVWTMFIIFSILFLDIIACFVHERWAIDWVFTDLWDNYGFVVIVVSFSSHWLYWRASMTLVFF